MIIRREKHSDYKAIYDLVKDAFPTEAEAKLIDQLRIDGTAVISMVAVIDNNLVGHIMMSKMSAPFRALGLGPLAVAATHRQKGIGGRLIVSALEEAKKEKWQCVFVLGNPAFYKKFGFDPETASGFKCRYSGPDLMALAIEMPLPVASGNILYASAFDNLD